MRSHEAAQEGKHNGIASAKTGKAYWIFVYIFEFKIRGKLTGGHDVRKSHEFIILSAAYYFTKEAKNETTAETTCDC